MIGAFAIFFGAIVLGLLLPNLRRHDRVLYLGGRPYRLVSFREPLFDTQRFLGLGVPVATINVFQGFFKFRQSDLLTVHFDEGVRVRPRWFRNVWSMTTWQRRQMLAASARARRP